MRKTIVFTTIGVFVLILLVPLIFKDRTEWSFNGPDLSEMQYTEITFKSGELNLAGMLYLPEGEGPFPTVVFIHGSGTSKRNNPWYLAVVKHLQENGIAVLLPDKRGSERSEGDWTESNFEDFATDASSAIDFIKGQTMFESSYIGVLGHSQGGWVVPIVAAQDRDAAFAIGWSGPGVTVDEQILYGEVNYIADMGTYPFIAELIAPFAVRGFIDGDCCRMIVGFDPIPYWRQVETPSFMAFGEDDRNVPVEESMKRLDALDNANLTLKVYPGSGHGIEESVTPGILQIRQEFLRDVVDFIHKVE